MNLNLLGSLVIIGILAVLAAILGQRRRGVELDQTWPLERKTALLTESERRLYRRLVQALPHKLVFPQVQLQQILRFKRGRWNAGIANRISQLSIDFLIVEPDTSIVAAVELDDASHDREARRAADARKAHALRSAGIALLRWSVGEMPEEPDIAVALEKAVQASGEGARRDWPRS